ncbi:unnamed protein product [Rangifer tarandus platyrhynchus]|uniref:Uncharacterized protein n=2 Tax=Rangifer tarandus platyrhynchus TaxID=3082113 RepID=A0AC59Y9H8_RANTA|nr:unnamed protein product [Rangifer tarandus platyrhynchus]
MAGLRGAQEAGGQEGVSPGQGLLCGPETQVQGLLGEFHRPRPSRAESPRPLSAAEGLLEAQGLCLQWQPVGSRSGVHKGLRPSHLWALVLNTQQLPTLARAPRCYLPTEAAGRAGPGAPTAGASSFSVCTSLRAGPACPSALPSCCA